MTVTGSAKLLEQGIAIARDGHRTLAQMYLRRAAEESPSDPDFWLWMAWLAESPAEMVYCLESLLAAQPDHSLAQDGLRWARGVADVIANHAPGLEFSGPQDTTDFEWTSVVDASPADSGRCELHAVETLGVAIAAVEELVLDIAPPPYCEEAYDELSSQPTAAPLPVDPPLADPGLTDAPLASAVPEAALPEESLPEASLSEESLPDPTLAAPELLDAPLVDESWADADLPLADESPLNELAGASTLTELLFDDSLPASPVENAVTESPELPEESLEFPPSLMVGEEGAGKETHFDAEADLQIDVAQEEPVVPWLLAEQPALLRRDSLPASPLVNAFAAPPELPEKVLENPHSLAVGDEAGGETQFDAGEDLQIDSEQDEPVVPLSLAEQPRPELAPVECQLATVVDQLLEPATVEQPPAVEQPAPQELQKLDVPQDAPAVDFVVEGKSPAILVVDDSQTVRKLVTMTLSKHGYRVFSAADGVAAIEAIQACEPALIILDIDTPRLDGYKFFNLVKQGESTKGIKVVMLSGKDGIIDKVRRRMNGCTDTLTKPFSPETLLKMVEKCIVSRNQPPLTNSEADKSVEPCARPTAEPLPDGLDNHCILHLSRLEHQVSLLHNATTAEGRQQALQSARTILADTLEFLQVTERKELLDRNRDDICRIHEEIKKVDQLLEWPSLWGLLGVRTSAEQTQRQAFDTLGVGYAKLLESLLTQIGATFQGESHAAEWEASVRPLLVDIKRLW